MSLLIPAELSAESAYGPSGEFRELLFHQSRTVRREPGSSEPPPAFLALHRPTASSGFTAEESPASIWPREVLQMGKQLTRREREFSIAKAGDVHVLPVRTHVLDVC
ncbi:MAG TPA: hypothetical protein VM260_13525 [Pirellula sp.]|nr:hypothetical protein [Pirellula sp.]